METGTDIHSDFWKKVGVSARSFRIRLTNSLDEFVFLPGLQSVLVVVYNSIYNSGFIAISACVFTTVMYLCIYAYIIGATAIYR